MQRLISAGQSDDDISRATGIPRTTVHGWRTRPPLSVRRPRGSSPCGVGHDFSTLPAAQYAYLLGVYLGDGCISRARRVWRLRIACDAKYPGIIDLCRTSMNLVMPGQRAAVQRLPKNCVQVSMYSKHWPCLFPQHGPGRKHTRLIALEPWQQDLVDQATEEFVRGLIHSDGCRVVANDRGVTSVRYHFSNRSEDIIGLFTAALDRLGIHWTRSDDHTVSIYRKADTTALDAFIGPKALAVPWTDVHYTA
ncbi:LAGLIDADG family homing endonuclease [Mycolicibacterium sediminis]|uniref:LAGLIDADG family homing endonuclease n=1 Tax=Mycolicibacterium sediminis TaxID=1286180 RepID=UPI003CD0746A